MTSNVPSNVTASSTFNVPLTVVITPDEATVTVPPPVANEVSPDESNVLTDASPVTSNVPAMAVFPVAEATVNLSVFTSRSPSTPVAPVTSNVPFKSVPPATTKLSVT